MRKNFGNFETRWDWFGLIHVEWACWRSTVHSGLLRLYGRFLIHSLLFAFYSVVGGHNQHMSVPFVFPQFSYLRLRFVFISHLLHSFLFTHSPNVPSPRARLVNILYTVLILETDPAS